MGTLKKLGVETAKLSLIALLGLAGCSGCPKPRMGCLPTPNLTTRFAGIEDLKKKELLCSGNRMVYTCDGGHIDMDHLCETADWTIHLAKQTEKCLIKKLDKIEFNFDNSVYTLNINYPENWNSLADAEKKKVSEDVSIGLGEYLAFKATTFHEIMTYLGYMPHWSVSEFSSAFSWEDNYSNLLGCRDAAIALKDKSKPIKESLSLVIENELLSLGIQPAKTARKASEKMKDKWYDKCFLLDSRMLKRNYDIGLEDGKVTPWLVSGLDGCDNAKPRAYPVPKLDFLRNYGLSVGLRIEPRVAEKNLVLRIAYPNGKQEKFIEPEKHFPLIMRHIVENDGK